MLSAVPLWLHLLAAAAWVGSQLMMLLVVAPSLRLTSNARARHEIVRGVTVRFGYLGFASLVVLLLSGVDNMSRLSPPAMFELRYGYILALKLVLVVAVVGITAYHAFVAGPRLLDLQAKGLDGDDVSPSLMRSARARSIAASAAVLLLSLVILFCAALLRTSFAFQPA